MENENTVAAAENVPDGIREAAIEIEEILKKRGLGLQAVLQIYKVEKSPVVASGNGEIPKELLEAMTKVEGDAFPEITEAKVEATEPVAGVGALNNEAH